MKSHSFIPTLSVPQRRIALFPGTFDPYTIGHESLVRRGLTLVDELVIAIGVNEAKKTCFSLEKRLLTIRNFYKSNPRIRVESYEGLTVDFAREVGAKYILRGIRSVNDFEYEKAVADLNRSISGIETFVLFTEPQLTHISSTLVRELLRYGRDISEFVPAGMKW
jgi:pantetheine-phosphate adenylyltransferase